MSSLASNAPDIEKQLYELAQHAYLHYERTVQPLYPWLLLYVLPKEDQVRGIIRPDVQNKVMYEGIVLSTWRPRLEDVSVRENGTLRIETHIRKSQMELGDHILFPHWVGLPCPWLPEERFRMIEELKPLDPKSEPIARLNYDLESTDVVIRNAVETAFSKEFDSLSDSTVNAIIRELHREFHLIRINRAPRTMSGK
jgi:hypothetical protein